MIGHQGSRLREVGTAARQQIQALLGTPVYLDLHVKIAKDWQRDPRSCAGSASSPRCTLETAVVVPQTTAETALVPRRGDIGAVSAGSVRQ